MRPTMLRALGLLTVFTTTSHALPAKPALSVETEILGSAPGARWTVPIGINNRGEMAVAGLLPVEGWSTFYWTRDTGFQLIALGSSPTDINERGEIVGHHCIYSPCTPSGFLWSAKGGFRDLGNFLPNAVNDRGDMAGLCEAGACAARNGVLTVLPVSDCGEECSGIPSGINNSGDVIGWTYSLDQIEQAVIWPRAGGQVKLGPGTAEDLNNAGMIVGRSSGQPRAWTDHEVLTAPTAQLSSAAWAINASGSVVGVGNDFDRAFFWDPEKAIFFFLAPPLSEAIDINDRGDIVGTINGFSQAVIWRVTSTHSRDAVIGDLVEVFHAPEKPEPHGQRPRSHVFLQSSARASWWLSWLAVRPI